MKGYLFAMISIMLVTVAQLVMKIGVGYLPQTELFTLVLQTPWLYSTALLLISIGLLAYVSSIVCWMVVLNYLPLNRAYPLLSLSYGLVYLAAIALPWFNEPFSWMRFSGIISIIAGIIVMNWRHVPTK